MRRYLGGLSFVIVVGLIVAGVAVLLNHEARLPGAVTGAPQNGSVFVKEDVFPFAPCSDPDFVKTHPRYATCGSNSLENVNWVTYSDPIITLPRNTLVTMEITNYDSPTSLVDNYFLAPQGVSYNGQQNAINLDGKVYTANDTKSLTDSQNGVAASISHTFVIHSIVSSHQPWFYVAVPVAGSTDTHADAAGMPNKPAVTTFSFMTPSQPGEYVWQCFVPCGSGFNGFGGPMSTKGYMSGTVTVQ
ncbi:MAG: hypothetical protein ABI068_05510 [Ktedonobacterales bacterium]